jgi:D-glycero-alpha-D-manno-heptose-7-phosphate kinase
MIISQTPFRISFVGGGTDFEDFYRKYPGRVLSTSINKYIYLSVNPKFDGQLRISYARTENVENRKEVQHPIVKAVLEEVGIEKGIEITSVGDIPGRGTGLGSSSSFTVGLLNVLYSYLGKYAPPEFLAEKACQVEIEKVGSPIGKQDQYAAAFGGLNQITFNTNGKTEVEPIYLPPKLKEDFQNHLLLFYTGQQRASAPILAEQKENIEKKFEFLRKLSDLVPVFREALEKGDFKKMGEILHQNWLMKKELSSGISNPQLEEMYNLALKAGAWGGKILGAGGGGFLLVLSSPENQGKIKEALRNYQLMPFRFTEAGSKIVFKS